MLPQLIYLAFVFLGLGITMVNHGKPRSAEDFWTTLIAQVLTVLLLWWGGFFDPLIGALVIK